MPANRVYIPARESVFTPANHPGFRPRTRVINGSGPNPRYRGTKLRANLPQPYINPDFLTLLSQRGPSSSSSSSSSSPSSFRVPSHAGFPSRYNAANRGACITLSRLFARRHPTKSYQNPRRVIPLPPRDLPRGGNTHRTWSGLSLSDPLTFTADVSPNRERNGSSPETGRPRALRRTSRNPN